MDDYIKREDAINAFDDPRVESNYGDVSPSSVIDVIKTIPAADVRENVRGEWIEKIVGNPAGGGSLGVSECTRCGCFVFATAVYGDLNYCPNCGADMRKETK